MLQGFLRSWRLWLLGLVLLNSATSSVTATPLNQISQAVPPAAGQNHREGGIEQLLAQAEKLRLEGKYDAAFPLAQAAVEQSEQTFGPESQRLAESLDLLASLAEAKGDRSRAEVLYQRSLTIREKILGPTHLETGRSLNHLARLAWEKFDYGKAEILFQRSLAITEQALGPDHPDLAASLLEVAERYYTIADFVRAEPLFNRVLAIRERSLGPEHGETAQVLSSLAFLYKAKGEFQRSEACFQRAMAIWEKTSGDTSLEDADRLSRLAELCWENFDYNKAEALFQRSLAIREQALGPDHPDLATCFQQRAITYYNQGNFAKAELYYQRALAIRQKAFGFEHPDVASSLHDLANLYLTKGDVIDAEPLLQQALIATEKSLGPDHPVMAYVLNHLGRLYDVKGELDRAEPYFERALAIREKALPPDHVDMADSYTFLGCHYRTKGDYAKAEPYFERALAIREKAVGSENLWIAFSLQNLATLYQLKGDFSKAELLFKRALQVGEKAQGPNHPSLAPMLFCLSGHYLARGEVEQAVTCQTRANEISEQDVVRNLVSGSERQKLLYLKRSAKYTDQTVSLNVQAAPNNLAARQAALKVLLQRKGRALDALPSSIETLRRQQTAETQKLLENYASLASQISALTLRGPGGRKLEDHLARLRSLGELKEKLEGEISQRSQEFQVYITPVTLDRVCQQIPGDAVLLEYAVYHPYDAVSDTFGPSRYVVYTLDRKGIIGCVDLGEATLIEESATALRQILKNPAANFEKEVKPAAQTLERLIFKPLRNEIGKARHLLISPDGSLNLIPFAALMDREGTFLTEQFRLTYLTSGRDLLRLAVKIESRNPPLVLADPDYSTGLGPVLLGRQFAPLTRLKGTEAEGIALKTLFPQANLKMKAAAQAETVKTIRRPELLHIATHGYFLKDDPPTTSPNGVRILVREDSPVDEVQLRVENPLLRAWLFFAGANRTGTGSKSSVLTALETAQLDLWGTKLVVLSACETGFGETTDGNGVYGLRRALVLAGSETQMMSLWPVSDRGTQELMMRYYQRLKAGEGRSDALRNAQLTLLRNPKRRHPFYWAAFIQSGEWASLSGQRK
ncbi:MAG: CHAT domain-containing protein [Blastocatellia bacterium]|nr:CHAT domain-containing protein [Blastocatellia bacterium]